MKTVCSIDCCAGCRACENACVHKAISIVDSIYAYNAVINEDLCVNCAKCYKLCPQNNLSKLNEPIKWIQGWASDKSIRNNSSSGGFATAIGASFVSQGGLVATCFVRDGEFKFDLTFDENMLSKSAGSKYVKSDTGNIYEKVKEQLIKKKVLFIGLPCQVAGLINYIPDHLKHNLYTIDLICHGSPSPKVLEKFLYHYKITINDIKDITFRIKKSQETSYKKITPHGVADRYTLAFLKGLSYTENCYNCKYAGIQRCSDITLGDSWGSELPLVEQKKGISLALIQTEKGNELIGMAHLIKKEVSLERAIECNGQLRTPFRRINERDKFLKGIKEGKDIYNLIGKCFWKMCLRQDIKRILIKLHVIKENSAGGGYSIRYLYDKTK